MGRAEVNTKERRRRRNESEGEKNDKSKCVRDRTRNHLITLPESLIWFTRSMIGRRERRFNFLSGLFYGSAYFLEIPHLLQQETLQYNQKGFTVKMTREIVRDNKS